MVEHPDGSARVHLITGTSLDFSFSSEHTHQAVLTKNVRAKLGPYLVDEKLVPIGSGFAANRVSPDWALGDSSKNPSNVFLIFEVGMRVGTLSK